MSKAFKCDYCHEFTKDDFGSGGPRDTIPKSRGKHDGGYIQYEMFVDGQIHANACQDCATAHLSRLSTVIATIKKP